MSVTCLAFTGWMVAAWMVTPRIVTCGGLPVVAGTPATSPGSLMYCPQRYAAMVRPFWE